MGRWYLRFIFYKYYRLREVAQRNDVERECHIVVTSIERTRHLAACHIDGSFYPPIMRREAAVEVMVKLYFMVEEQTIAGVGACHYATADVSAILHPGSAQRTADVRGIKYPPHSADGIAKFRGLPHADGAVGHRFYERTFKSIMLDVLILRVWIILDD